MEHKTVFISEFQITCAYSIVGKGPNVMLIHGLCESNEIWAEHAESLSQSYRVLLPDLPGFGKSEPFTDGNFDLERVQKVVFAMADAEGFDKFAMVGHSMGGYTALAMIEAQPKRINGISLFHSTAQADSEEKKKGRDKSIKVLNQNRNLFFKEVFKNLFNSKRLPEFMPLVQGLYEASERIETQTVTGTLAALRDRKDRLALLNKFYGHISYFIGRHDNVLPADDLIAEAESLVADYHVAEECGHMGFYESPEEVDDYLFAFLEEVENVEED